MNHHTPAVVDGVVIDEVARRALEPGRPAEMLQTYVKAATDRDRADRDRLSKLRTEHEEAKVQRLRGLVEKGLMHDEDPEFRDRPRGLEPRQDEIGRWTRFAVGDQEIRIIGSKAALERVAFGPFGASPAVLSSVRGWWGK